MFFSQSASAVASFSHCSQLNVDDSAIDFIHFLSPNGINRVCFCPLKVLFRDDLLSVTPVE